MYFREDKPEEAAELFREVIRQYPDSHEAEYSGSILEQMAEHSDASSDKIPAKILALLDDEPHGEGGWGHTISILIVTLAAFVVLGVSQSRMSIVMALVVGIFFHECGHLLAMKLAGHTHLKLFFIPMFGGAAAGQSKREDALDNALIALAGPFMGMTSAVAASVLFRLNPYPFLETYVTVALFINALNLLPVYPLDGGRFVGELLFTRHPRADTGFRVVAAAIILLMGIRYQDVMLIMLGIVVLVSIKRSSAVLQVSRAYLETYGDGNRADTEGIAFIWNHLKARLPGLAEEKDVKKRIVPLVRTVLRKVEARHAAWRQIAMSFLAYMFTLVFLPLIAAAVMYQS